MWRHDSERSGFTDESLGDSLELQWSYQMTDEPQPALAAFGANDLRIGPLGQSSQKEKFSSAAASMAPSMLWTPPAARRSGLSQREAQSASLRSMPMVEFLR